MPETLNDKLDSMAKVRKLDDQQKQIILTMADAQIDLMVNHFKDIETTRKDTKGNTLQIGMAYTVTQESGASNVKSVISFSKKFRDGREDHLGDPNQVTMDFERNGAVPEKKAKKAKRGKK